MKPIKALIICYDFNPLNTVGAHRVDSWSKHLSEHGIYPTVVTRKWNVDIKQSSDYYQNETGAVEKIVTEECEVIRFPYQMHFLERLNHALTARNLIVLRKILTLLTTFLKWLPGITTEKTFYTSQLPKAINFSDYQVIVVSGEPFILFKYAYELAQKYNIPYLLDYRDGYTTNAARTDAGVRWFINAFENRMEKKVYNKAAHFTTVSESIAEDLCAKFGHKNHTIVENGIDLTTFNQVTIDKDPFFHIVYTGSVYDLHDVGSFLTAFKQFIKKHPDDHIQMTFAGIGHFGSKGVDAIHKLQEAYPKQVTILPRLSKIDSITLQKRSTILLKFSYAPMLKGFYGAKLYEYVACNKPIISVVGDPKNAKTDFFEEKGIQQFCCNSTEVLTALEQNLQLFKTDAIPNNFLTENNIYSISRKHKSKILAQAIKDCLRSS